MRLSRPLDEIEPSYDVVVVGSGYGGGVAASRLARIGLKVAVLERGREFALGEFPDTLPEAMGELQYTLGGTRHGRRTGLFDLHMGRDMHVLVGCGLGGTSLINANVSLPPDPRVWEDRCWPHGMLADDTLEEGFARAQRMLRPVPYPNQVRLDKLARLKQAAERLGTELTRPPLNIAFTDGPNAAGVRQPACTMCGDCCSGCNVGAKSTVQMTYLPDAVRHGAHVFTEVTVHHVRKEGGGWRVLFEPTPRRRDRFDTPERSVSARFVILAAGSLGSTEILLRSREAGLHVSDRLGERFTGNGDVLAFAYNGEQPANAVGIGHPPRAGVSPPGPCIAGAIDLRGADRLENGMIIEEGVLPSGLAEILPATFSIARVFGKDTDSGLLDDFQEAVRRVDSLALGAWRGAMHNTETYLVMAHDDGNGRLGLHDDQIMVDWPKAARQPVYDRIEEALLTAAGANGATYIRNPVQNTFLGENLITVHPLGGCAMGTDRTTGVVDHLSRVFDARSSDADAVHDGLYVCDGAIMPRPLGVNPLLTITALAERAMIHLARQLGRALTDAPMAGAEVLDPTSRPIGPVPAGVSFTERMAGHVALAEGGADHVAAAASGERKGQALSFTVTIAIPDVATFTADPNHHGGLTGIVDAPLLSAEPLDITDGVFSLMRRDETAVETRRFEYLMTLTSREGRRFKFAGHKLVHDDRSPGDLVRDTTTLFVDIEEVGGRGQRFHGILRIEPVDFARQMRTLAGTGGADAVDRLKAVAQFGALFAGQLFDVYGDVLAPLRRHDPDRVRKRRGLRVGDPDVHYFDTADRKRLRLIHYRGGTKGPLLMTHGLGVSSSIFTIDTIDTNLLEFMVAAGYDCWLLDFRASIDLPYARELWTADDAARYDYQPAVDLILATTGASSVQVLAHCFGATTFVMAMLGGSLTGVRSAVISQIACDVIVPWFPQRLLAHLRAPSILDRLGVDFVNARATTQDGTLNRIIDGLIRVFVPFQRDERSRNATSNRITALYGQLYESRQLNHLTFEAGLPEMFGEANIAAFQHLGLIARRKMIVDANGNDVYMPNLDRLAIPISFIHGAKNACFLPESTALTVTKLTARNGARLYERHVIPDYGHIDCIFGKQAASDVYPLMLAHLERTADAKAVVAPPEVPVT